MQTWRHKVISGGSITHVCQTVYCTPHTSEWIVHFRRTFRIRLPTVNHGNCEVVKPIYSYRICRGCHHLSAPPSPFRIVCRAEHFVTAKASRHTLHLDSEQSIGRNILNTQGMPQCHESIIMFLWAYWIMASGMSSLY